MSQKKKLKEKININTFFVFNDNNLHEYNIDTYNLGKEIVYELKYSNGEQWINNDKVIITIKDNKDNGYTYVFNNEFTPGFLDNAQISDLQLLLTFIKQQSLLESFYSFDTYKYINSNTFTAI